MDYVTGRIGTWQGEKRPGSRFSSMPQHRVVGGFAGQREYSAGDIVGQPHAGLFELVQERRNPLHKPVRLPFEQDLERTPYGETGGPSDASRQPIIQEKALEANRRHGCDRDRPKARCY